jgi:Protein of unknown function (DUF2530)
MSDRSSPTGDQPGQAPEPAPPLEANDQLVTALITVGWAVALVVLLSVHGDLPARERWWIWTTVAGFGMGLFGLVYVPHLKRSRARTAQRQAQRADAGPAQPAVASSDRSGSDQP